MRSASSSAFFLAAAASFFAAAASTFFLAASSSAMRLGSSYFFAVSVSQGCEGESPSMTACTEPFSGGVYPGSWLFRRLPRAMISSCRRMTASSRASGRGGQPGR